MILVIHVIRVIHTERGRPTGDWESVNTVTAIPFGRTVHNKNAVKYREEQNPTAHAAMPNTEAATRVAMNVVVAVLHPYRTANVLIPADRSALSSSTVYKIS